MSFTNYHLPWVLIIDHARHIIHATLDQAEARQLLTLSIERASELPLVISLLLTTVCHALRPPLPSQHLLTGLAFRAIQSLQTAYTFICSPSCITTAQKRMRCLSQFVASATPLSMYEGTQQPISSMVHALLLRSITSNISQYSSETEKLLLAAVDIPATLVPHTQPLRPILQALDDSSLRELSPNLMVRNRVWL